MTFLHTNAPRARLARLLSTSVLGVLALVHVASAALGYGAEESVVNEPLHIALLIAASAAAVTGALTRTDRRAPWVWLAFAVCLWTVGELVYTYVIAHLDPVPYPSASDALWLATPVASYVTVALITRERLRNVGDEMWLDGLIGALATGAIGAALIFQPILEHTGGTPAAIATNLAYPLTDLLLLSLMVPLCVLTGWRPGRDVLWMIAGFAMLAVADSIYLVRVGTGTYVDGMIVDTLWPLAMLLLARATWEPRRDADAAALEGWRVFAVPLVATLAAVTLLVTGNLEPIGGLALALAAATLIAGISRMGMTFSALRRLSDNRRRESVTDALTGLGNRRKLLGDLHELFASEPSGYFLTLFDLDGFKGYNDTFGHPAGDELLARLGGNLSTAIKPWGRAYRLGGDEFCAVFCPGDADQGSIVAGMASALTEVGDGFAISASYGTVWIPEEATDASRALHVADQRMYAHKDGRPSSPRYQMRDLLLKALDEREPAMRDHASDVSGLALGVADRLGLPERELDDIGRAAELHDIGKLAIPEQILQKPAALDASEWAFMRRHTLIGERILGAANALATVAKLVRASHERWDGDGYPDGLSGEEIPLGSRIIAVCDAYDAMTTDRPYRAGMSRRHALEELSKCAGGQFDPIVVSLFVEEVETRLDRQELAGRVAGSVNGRAKSSVSGRPKGGVTGLAKGSANGRPKSRPRRSSTRS